jgi:RHS repeat-associated protein
MFHKLHSSMSKSSPGGDPRWSRGHLLTLRARNREETIFDVSFPNDWHRQLGWKLGNETGDTTTQLYQVRNRAYSPLLGIWITRDPAGYVDGNNLYQYCNLRPLIAIDSDGRWLLVTIGIGVAIGGVLGGISGFVSGGVQGALYGAARGAIVGGVTGAVLGIGGAAIAGGVTSVLTGSLGGTAAGYAGGFAAGGAASGLGEAAGQALDYGTFGKPPSLTEVGIKAFEGGAFGSVLIRGPNPFGGRTPIAKWYPEGTAPTPPQPGQFVQCGEKTAENCIRTLTGYPSYNAWFDNVPTSNLAQPPGAFGNAQSLLGHMIYTP